MIPVDRHLEGRAHLGHVLNWWLRRCNITHSMATALAAWVCGDSTWLQGSQLSHLRNGRMRTPQLKLMEGLAGLNEAFAAWKIDGPEACRKRWGPLPDNAPAPFVMDEAVFLWHPDDLERMQPLVFRDFCDLFVGYLRLPYVDDGVVSPGQSRLISDRISEELDMWMLGEGSVRAAMMTLADLYPGTPARLDKLRRVAQGLESYTSDELEDEAYALGELFSAIRGRQITGPELYAELTADPPQ